MQESHPTNRRTSVCRFIVSKVIEDEIAHEDGYDIFEPTVGLEVAGTNIFNELRLDGAGNVVIMHFLEIALGKTLRLIDDVSRNPKGEYEFWLLGSRYGIELERDGSALEVTLQVGYQHGDSNGMQEKTTGPITVGDWVDSVVQLAKELSDLFERLNPRMYHLVKELDPRRKALEQWLAAPR